LVPYSKLLLPRRKLKRTSLSIKHFRSISKTTLHTTKMIHLVTSERKPNVSFAEIVTLIEMILAILPMGLLD